MKKLCTLMSVFLCLALVGCSNVITEGEVYDKEHREAQVILTTMPVVHNTGKMSYTTLVPVTWCYPERYVIFIRAYDSESKKWKSEDYYVEEEIYDATNVGDYFIFDEETMLQDEPREKQDN